MWIDFEGIDGSGKTTLSNRVASRLRDEGRAVVHLREGGQLGSRISGRVRELTRDAANLELGDRTELLLNCAREVQLLDERLRPALARGGIVIADRSLYSHLAMACGGRGVPPEEAREVAAFTANGLWPDLVVLVDVEPALAKARKRCRKLAETDAGSGGGGRKGLAGEGLPPRMRASLRALARRDPDRWLVLVNDGATLEQLEERVVAAVRERLARPRALPAPTSEQLVASTGRTPPEPGPERDVEEPALRAWLFRRLASLAEREPGVAACLMSGLEGADAHALRERLAFAVPEAVAWSLSGSDDEPSWRLRQLLAGRVPAQVAKSLGRLPPEAQPRAMELRGALAAVAPGEVARSLQGVALSAAMALRTRLSKSAPAEVLESLAWVDPAEAWAVRNEIGFVREELARGLLAGLAGDDTDRAWALRDRLADVSLLGLVESLRGLGGDRAHRLREKWADRAPRPVLKSLARTFDDRGWDLRERLLPRAPEALDALAGIDLEPAWRLRDAAAPLWPAKTLRSLGPLARTGRGENLLRRLVSAQPEGLATVRAGVLALQASRAPVRATTPCAERVEPAREASR